MRKALSRLGGGALLAGLSVLVSFAGSEATGTLRGRVLDPQGLPVQDATVVATRPGVHLAERSTTDASGGFSFPNLPLGEYQLEVTAPDLEKAQLKAQVSAGAPAEVEVRLRLAGLHQGVTVAASRREQATYEVPASASVMTQEELEHRLAVNLAESLRDLPGIESVEAGAFRARPVIRGLDSNRILVLVDGERLNNGRTSTESAGIETSLVGVDAVDRIEVIRGPGSVLYGSDALGGIINIVTSNVQRAASGFRLGGKLSVEYDSSGAGRRGFLSLYGSTRKVSVGLSGTLRTIEDYWSPLGRVSGTGVREDANLAEVRFYPATDQSFFIKYLRHNAWDYGFAMLVPDPSFVAAFPFSKLSKISTGYNGHFAKPAFSSFTANFYYQEQDRNFSYQIAVPGFSLSSSTVTRTRSFGFDTQATALLPGRQVITYGVSFYRDNNTDGSLQTIFPGTSWAQVVSRSPSVPQAAISGTGIFVQDQVSVSSRLHLTGGLRFDVFKLRVFPTENFPADALTGILGGRVDSAVSGQVGAIYEVVPGLQLVGNVGRAFREPNLFERFFYGSAPVEAFIVPNPVLKPETSLSFETGARLHASRFSASVTYFHNQLRDLITYAPGTFNGQTTLDGVPVYQNVNVNRSRIQGVEAEVETQRSALGSYWTPFLAMSFQKGTDLGTGDALPLIAPAVGHVGLRWETSRRRLWAEVRARVTRGSTRVPPEFDPLQGFSMFSLRGGCELVRGDRARLFARGLKSVALRFGFENLGNRVYRELFNSVPEAGRHARVGLDFTF